MSLASSPVEGQRDENVLIGQEKLILDIDTDMGNLVRIWSALQGLYSISQLWAEYYRTPPSKNTFFYLWDLEKT